MSCQRYATAIADHACGADLAPEVAAHLETCVRCASQLAAQRRTIDDLDAELQQMVAVEPSPFFVQRVQAHVMTSPDRRSFRAWWWSAAVAAAAIVLAVLFLSVDRRPPAPIQARTITPPPAPAAKNEPPTIVATAPSRKEAPVSRYQPSQPQRRVAKPPEPEVLVPKDQMRVVDRYMALVRSGSLDTTTLASDTDPSTEMIVNPLDIKPIVVVEINPATSPAVEGGTNKEQTK